MSRDLRKLSADKQQTSNKTAYLELNKSSYSAASLSNPIQQPNPLLLPSGGATINNGLANSLSSKLINSMQGNETVLPPSPLQFDSSTPLKNSRQRVKISNIHTTHPIQSMGLGSFNIQERPPSRLEINSLEVELEERVRLVLDSDGLPSTKSTGMATSTSASAFTFQPHKEAMSLARERMLAELNPPHDEGNEPWLNTFIKCECLKITCDEISAKFSDMLSVSSYELGNVLRKLRLTYKQSFEQMNFSWKTLRSAFLGASKELARCKQKMASMQTELDEKEAHVQTRFQAELHQLQVERDAERAADKEQIAQAEFKMDQMNETLKYLNGIFKTMQSDTSSLNTVDLQAKCFRLEKENKELSENHLILESLKTKLAASEQRSSQLEESTASLEKEVRTLQDQLARRDEVISGLMEREALRNAEIEKLQKISKIKETELEAIDLKDPATSVLCIKCKKSLDDLSNIRSAVMGDGPAGNATADGKSAIRLQCENYRILLPNLKGRHPNRTTLWIRTVVRCILVCKMREDLSLFGIKGQLTSFPAFTYAWFAKDVSGLSGAPLTKALFQADEDRWGLYYGIKALTRESDPEAMIFWSLLDDTFGEDGCQFVVHCLSIVLSMGGSKLWRQLGPCLNNCSSINDKPGDDYHCPPTIWLEVETAKEAVRVILVRALGPHVVEAIEAIDALKVKPDRLELMESGHAGDAHVDLEGSGSVYSSANHSNEGIEDHSKHSHDGKKHKSTRHKHKGGDGNSSAPTHINLFMWLRLMLQQLHADQIHRAAAIRLMFETASVGALTPAPVGGVDSKAGNFVEYPQFQSICQTLFPHLSLSEIASLFSECHDSGRNKVTAEVFTRFANRRGYFSQSLKLAQLPLLAQHIASADVSRKIEDVMEAALLIEESRHFNESNALKELTQMDKLMESEPHGYTSKVEKIIRSKLATLVHRKLAMTSPSIRHLAKNAPHKWGVMLLDAIDAVNAALNDSHHKMVLKFSTTQAANSQDKNGDHATVNITVPSKHFIDGIQPYICYRRLIVLASFVKILCDNPLLPTEVFSLSDVDKSNPSMDSALYKAELTLSGMERGVVSMSNSSKAAVMAYDRYKSFDEVRRTLVARRIQLLFKKFLAKEVAIPRAVRMNMSAGYLCHNRGLSRTAGTKHFVKNREFYHEPWWGQLMVAEIYRFKLLYDMKAICMGLPPLSLAQAVVAFSYKHWGCLELSERATQDLFICIKAYRSGLPRLRLFAAFLGDGRELDDSVADMLRTPHAVAVYLNLLLEVHIEMQKVHKDLQPAEENRELKAMGAILGSNAAEDDNDGLRRENDGKLRTIEILFPTTEDTNERTDKRDVWYLETAILVRVLQRWCISQSLVEGNFNVYTDLVQKLKTNAAGKVEVDDFLWITMIQWAKLSAWVLKRIASKSAALEKSLALRGHATLTPQQQKKAVISLPPMQLSQLKMVVESVYPSNKQQPQASQNQGAASNGATSDIADPVFFSTSYFGRLIVSKGTMLVSIDTVSKVDSLLLTPITKGPKVMSTFCKEFDKTLASCILWDTNCNLFKAPLPVNRSLSSSSASFSIVSTQLDSDPQNSRKSIAVPSEGMNPNNSQSIAGGYKPPLLQCPAILLASNPAQSYGAARKAFIAYQASINNFIAKIAENPKYAEDADVSRRVQTIRLEILTLTETLQAPELDNKTHRLYAQDASQPLSREQLKNLLQARAENAVFNTKCWALLQGFISSVLDLVYYVGEEFPRDQWTGGVKLHLDRAYVYSIHTKSSIS